MPILNYTTKIPADKSVAEIQKMLAKAGASAIMQEFDPEGLISALSFKLRLGDGKEAGFRLPTKWEPVQVLITKSRAERRYRTKEQAINVSWRIVKDWIEAQLAIIQTEMVKADEVFFPYMIGAGGRTAYEQFNEDPSRVLGSGL